jgi:hypothetical protein
MLVEDRGWRVPAEEASGVGAAEPGAQPEREIGGYGPSVRASPGGGPRAQRA